MNFLPIADGAFLIDKQMHTLQLLAPWFCSHICGSRSLFLMIDALVQYKKMLHFVFSAIGFLNLHKDELSIYLNCISIVALIAN